MRSLPTVFVGIPTYNRPEGLLNTLSRIAGQSYKNIEILVSDNCSDDPQVIEILNKLSKEDSRIKWVRQSTNIGADKNFKYLLEKCSAEYFMWASDDDDWDPNFIKFCMNAILENEADAVMPGFCRFNKFHDRTTESNLPKLNGLDKFHDAKTFFSIMCHSIIYGLHRVSAIDWYVNDPGPMDDEFVLLKLILNNKVITFPEVNLYTATIETATYKLKHQEGPNRYMFQVRRLLRILTLIDETAAITDLQKLELSRLVAIRKLGIALLYEKDIRTAEQHNLALALYHILDSIRFNGPEDLLTLLHKLK
jgi:glycosyltransferase involved in cell wall biosynthesis